MPSDFIAGTWALVLPQIPLTIANAILATSLLTYDLFPKKGVDPPDRLSRTIGAMNLVSTPLGGFPMCHGAGGARRDVPVRREDRRGRTSSPGSSSSSSPSPSPPRRRS
ncbi:putative sulfate/molybdate transporter [Methanoculleus chikugoensis]|uniref:putative sulfate/molybdate transporter n=1 Tax=Methanoculleus chikugoensis TaxID=118126 RepID=UPI001FB3C521|nr:putative sulfate/molybdate transporter [Methanoculleus chikugoensis]